MKRSGLLVMFIFLGLASANQNDYFALSQGKKWTYSNGQVQEILGERNVAGKKVLVMTRKIESKGMAEDHLQITDAGVVLVGSKIGSQTMSYTPPLVLYPREPLYVGQSWSSSSKSSQGVVAFASRVVGSQGVATAVGRFNAFVIRTSVRTSSGAADSSDAYFVPTVGTVRFVTQSGTVDLIAKN